MMNSGVDVVLEQAGSAISELGVGDLVSPEEVAQRVTGMAIYWEKPVPAGERLLLIRLFSSVIQREEVFLGSILFNAFLSKAFLRVLDDLELGQAGLVANDVENYYFLVRTASNVEALANALRCVIERSLPDLFFGGANETRGIYGDLARMFTFRKSEFEPFPVYAVPESLAPALEKAVREQLRMLLTEDRFPGSLRTVLAAIAFFYGRTSGGSGDAQSFPNFVEHLATDGEYDNLLKADDVKRAFNINEVAKPAIKESIDKQTYSAKHLRQLLLGLINGFAASIDAGSAKWLVPFLRKDGKFISLEPSEYVNCLLGEVQLGYYLFQRSLNRMRVPCRLCNRVEAVVEDRYVTTGLGSFRFHNQSVRHQAEKVCPRCALYSYLGQKLLGTQMVSVAGKLPQVPKTYNLIFHYGKHTDDEIRRLADQIDDLWDLVRRHDDLDRIRRETRKQLLELNEKASHEHDSAKSLKLAEEITAKADELKAVDEDLQNAEKGIATKYPWVKEMGGSVVPAENHALDTLANLDVSENRVERHVLGLGISGYRMILFVLPQVRPSRNAGEHDFAQRRFSSSRIMVTALLSLLRELCGCDGPFYYQSLPVLSTDAFRQDTFYVRNEPIAVAKVQNEYEVVTQIAWKLVPRRGGKGFVRKVVLAERLLEAPLATFAEVMRGSLVPSQTKGPYRRLPGGYRQDWGTYDWTDYAAFINRLRRIQEVKRGGGES